MSERLLRDWRERAVLTEEEVCVVLRISRRTGYTWRQRGVLVPIRDVKPYRYAVRDIAALVDGGRAGASPENDDGLRRRVAADREMRRRLHLSRVPADRPGRSGRASGG